MTDGYLRGRRRSAGCSRGELGFCALDRAAAFDYLLWKPDHARLVGECILDSPPDPETGIALEGSTATWVVVVDRVQETYRTLLDKIVEREAQVAVARCYRAHEAEIRGDELIACGAVTSLRSAHQAAPADGIAGCGSGFELCVASSLARR